VVTTNALTFNLTGNGATGIKIDGGATGTVSNTTIIELEGNGAIAGLVDGRKINLAGTPGSSFASVLTNNAAIASNATDGVGFITQYGGTLNNNGVIDLGGTQNFGIIARSGGILNNTANVTVANGVGLLVEGAGSASQLSNTAAITAKDGIAAIEIIDGASLNGDATTGEIVAGGTAHGILIAAAGPDPQDPLNNLSAGVGLSLGANKITVTGTGNGVENAAEVSAVSFTGTTISAAAGAAIRTATAFATPPASTATLNVTGSGTGFLFQNADGSAATGPLTLGSGYTINVTGAGGRGIVADTDGAVNIASTVSVSNAAGGAALWLGAGVTDTTVTGSLTSTSTAAPVVDARQATAAQTFTNTSTGVITGASATGLAIAFGDQNTTFTNSGSITGVVNLGNGTNTALLNAGSHTSRVAGGTGQDTVTIVGTATFDSLEGGVGAGITDTLIFDGVKYAMPAGGGIDHFETMRLTNGTELTTQQPINMTDTAGGVGEIFIEGPTSATDTTPVSSLTMNMSVPYTFSHVLTGAGVLTASTGAGNAFAFTEDTGDAFTGKVILGASTFLLDGVNTATLANTQSLQLDTGNVTTVGVEPQSLPELAFNGGEVHFDANIPADQAASNVVTVERLNFMAGGGKAGVNLPDDYVAPAPDTLNNVNLLKQDDGPIYTKLIAAGAISGSVGGMTVMDRDGTDLSAVSGLVNIQQPSGTTVAVGSYGFDFASNNGISLNDGENPDNGLYVTWGLTQLDLQAGQTLTLAQDTGDTGAAATLTAKVIGAGNLEIDARDGVVILSNSTNSYTGKTTVSTGTLQLDADNALGQPDSAVNPLHAHTSELEIASGAAVNVNGTTQTIGAFTGQGSSNIALGGGTLNIDNGGNSSGAWTGAGTVNLNGGTLTAHAVNTFSAQAAMNVGAAATLDLQGLSQQVGGMNNSGMVKIGNPVATLPAVAVLTVNGNYVGNGGTVVLNTQLNDDSSITDQLVITGSASGNTTLQIIPRPNSNGASTVNGIKVVDVGGTSTDNAFQLPVNTTDGTRSIIGGARPYTLVERGEDWYLVNPQGDEPGPGPDPTCQTRDDCGGYRPEVDSYLNNRAIAMGSHIHTLHDRQAHSPGVFEQPGTLPDKNALDANSWVRLQGQFSHHASQNFTGSDNTYLLHLGTDVLRWKTGKDSEGMMRVGVMGMMMRSSGYSNALNVQEDAATRASQSVNGASVGVYATWFANRLDAETGAYVDAWLMGGSFRNKAGVEKYNSQGYTASVEAGYGFVVDEKKEPGRTERVIVQPQAQVVVGRYRAGDHRELSGDGNNIAADLNRTGVTTRLGVRIFADEVYGDARKEKDATRTRPFFEANWLHATSKNAMTFRSTLAGTERIKDSLPANLGEFKLGVEKNLSRNTTIWGYAAAQTSFSSRYNSVSVNAGLKYSW
jgi:autotransporter family porin